MKKSCTILLVITLILGLTQCKKDHSIIPSDTDGVFITLKMEDGNKHSVDPNLGVVTFENGDVIYVGDGSKYIGTLTRVNGSFSGTIKAPTDGTDIHFYFLGGLEPSATPDNSTTSFTVDLSDQREKLPVMSYNKVTYHEGVTEYSCQLKNQCALVKFRLSNGTDVPVRVGEVYTEAIVNFSSSPGIAPNKETMGFVTLYSESDDNKWAILLPQEENMPVVAIAGYQSKIMDPIPDLEPNNCISNGLNIVDDIALFSVGPNTTVQFSHGNLKATTSDAWASWTWSFMDHQYSTIEMNSDTYCTANYGNKTEVSLFGWGTSGFQDNRPNVYDGQNYQTYYYPFNTSDTEVEYEIFDPDNNMYITTPAYELNRYGYGPDFYDFGIYNHLTIASGSDWGVNFPVADGGFNWRTLTIEEWRWLIGPVGYFVEPGDEDYPEPGINCRTSSTVNGVANARGVLATIGTTHGLIIFPDLYVHPVGVAAPIGINDFCNLNTYWTAYWNDNQYNDTEWAKIEEAGAVFLPTSGFRVGTLVQSYGDFGTYWSSSSYETDSYAAYNFGFDDNRIDYYWTGRCQGNSVRLVREAY